MNYIKWKLNQWMLKLLKEEFNGAMPVMLVIDNVVLKEEHMPMVMPVKFTVNHYEFRYQNGINFLCLSIRSN